MSFGASAVGGTERKGEACERGKSSAVGCCRLIIAALHAHLPGSSSAVSRLVQTDCVRASRRHSAES